jgi:hypothetical protein
MKKKLTLLGLAFLLAFTLHAQNFTIGGTLVDQVSRSPLVGATVRLRSATDSLFQRSTISDSTGSFNFINLNRDSFILSISSVGYNPVTRGIRIDTTDISLDIAAATNTSSGLETVVVRTAISPVSQKGDTLQINASQFKVNPDASAEDLARKVPGITIENGQVKAQGENVRRVTIDGRELFGDDATAALRNLPAEIIDKIQIFDRLSDQAQFTGFDDGNTQKEINIVTRANMRNGQFGRVYAGYGTDSRYNVGGNATILSGDTRISIVGHINNINQQNFSQQDLLGVSSNAQRGGGGGGPRGGGGSPRGGSGNRPQGPGNQGGGNNGGFGSNGNFLVGQQAGINRTRALGVNYADQWGRKVKISGSYFFNNTNNTTNELSNTQYFNETLRDFSQDTRSESRNNNHRINMRIEYQIDSANQLIITPNLSFQDNRSNRRVASTFFNTAGIASAETINTNSNTRSGNNLNNTILYRHSFPKRGRTFSINLNTSYNKRDGETYFQTFDREFDNSVNDTSQRFTDQLNDGFQVSTNISYTEPLGANSQLQFSYNPTFSKSNANQQTYGFNAAEDEYSTRLDSLSNVFDNRSQAHNAGLSYRKGNRDNLFSVGLSYQRSSLNSEQTFPRRLTVDKDFSNVLPNAMFRRKLSARSNIRIMYRANTFNPSVTQLQDVPDPTNAPFYTVGNPELEQQYMHVLSTRYTFTNTSKGLLFVGNVFLQAGNNYIANATFVPIRDSSIGYGISLRPGQQLVKPVNLDGYASLRSFLTFAVPLKFIKSNFNLNGGFTLSRLPGLINNVQNQTKNYTYTLGTVIASNVSQYVDFTVSYSANFNQVRSNTLKSNNQDYFNHLAGLQLNLLSKKGWFFQNDLNSQLYSGLTEGFNQSYFLWNMSAGKKILKDQKGEIRLSVFDLLRQNQSIVRNVTETYIEDVQNQVLRQYFLLTFTYNLRNFGSAIGAGSGGGGR